MLRRFGQDEVKIVSPVQRPVLVSVSHCREALWLAVQAFMFL